MRDFSGIPPIDSIEARIRKNIPWHGRSGSQRQLPTSKNGSTWRCLSPRRRGWFELGYLFFETFYSLAISHQHHSAEEKAHGKKCYERRQIATWLLSLHVRPKFNGRQANCKPKRNPVSDGVNWRLMTIHGHLQAWCSLTMYCVLTD